MGCCQSSTAAAPPEPPAPFALPCRPEEFIAGDDLFLSEDYVPYTAILEHKCIVVRIVNVADGDTFRGRHIPNGHKLYPYPVVKAHQRTELFKKCQPWKGKLKGETLRLRIYAVDAPEVAKMGRPGQPYAEVLVPCSSLGKQASLKSINSLKSLASNKNVSWPLCRYFGGSQNDLSLSKKERVAWCEDVSQSLLLSGLATIYTGTNAQYNGNLSRLEQLLLEARDNKIGMFSGDEHAYESPATYKRRIKADHGGVYAASNNTLNLASQEPQRRGRSPTRRAPNASRESQSPSKRGSRRPGSQEARESVETEAQRGRPRERERRKKKSRSRSARRRRAAEKAAAAAGGVAEVRSAGGPIPASNDIRSAPSLRQGRLASEASGRVRNKTLTFSLDEPNADTVAKHDSRSSYRLTGASKGISSSPSRSANEFAPSRSRLYMHIDAEPLSGEEAPMSPLESVDLTDNEYVGAELDDSEFEDEDYGRY